MHGVGGFTGTLLTGVFAAGALSATADLPGGSPGLLEGNPGQLLTQAYAVGVTIVWAGVITWGLLRVIDLFTPLRVGQQNEIEGLDISQHGEALQ